MVLYQDTVCCRKFQHGTDRPTVDSTGSPELKHICAVKQRRPFRVHNSHRFWTVHGDRIALDRIVEAEKLPYPPGCTAENSQT